MQVQKIAGDPGLSVLRNAGSATTDTGQFSVLVGWGKGKGAIISNQDWSDGSQAGSGDLANVGVRELGYHSCNDHRGGRLDGFSESQNFCSSSCGRSVFCSLESHPALGDTNPLSQYFPTMKISPYGQLSDGQSVEMFTLEAPDGAYVEVITFGGVITRLVVPDRNGRMADVVMGYGNLDAYVAGKQLFGSLVGRVTGRIPHAQFSLNGRVYELAKNDGPNHLHGGICGFNKRVWSATPVTREDGADSVRLEFFSPDGEEGYPGNVRIAVTYTFTAKHEFIMEVDATTDSATPLSIAQHSYFHLGGEGTGSIHDHEMTIFSDRVFGKDDILTPLADLHPVQGKPEDLRHPRLLGDVMSKLFHQHGDFYFLKAAPGGQQVLAAQARHPASGRVLAVSTNESCMQFYTSAMLEGVHVGKSGTLYAPFSGFCFECHGHPAAMDHPSLPSILVTPETPLARTTTYAFSTCE